MDKTCIVKAHAVKSVAGPLPVTAARPLTCGLLQLAEQALTSSTQVNSPHRGALTAPCRSARETPPLKGPLLACCST